MSVRVPEYIDEPIRVQLIKVIETVIPNLPEDPFEIFVSTNLNRGELNYLGVWLFTSKLAVEIRNPLNQHRIQYDIYGFSDKVDWIRLNARNYEFGDPVEDSQLDLEFSTADGVSSGLSANGEGCTHLMRLYKEKFLRNFTGARGGE